MEERKPDKRDDDHIGDLQFECLLKVERKVGLGQKDKHKQSCAHVNSSHWVSQNQSLNTEVA